MILMYTSMERDMSSCLTQGGSGRTRSQTHTGAEEDLGLTVTQHQSSAAAFAHLPPI